jgi:spore coat-associated protein N
MRIPRKLVISIITVILAAGLVGTGALAYFQDTETSTDNTFTAGTLDLRLADQLELDGDDSVTATWTMNNMAPGVTHSGPWYVILSNTGSISAAHVEISFTNEIDENEETYIESETDPDNDTWEMAQWLEVTNITYSGINLLPVLSDENLNGFIDLDDMADPDNAPALDNLLAPPVVPPPGFGFMVFQMDILFNSGAGNDFQGDTLITTVTFTLNQDASQ